MLCSLNNPPQYVAISYNNNGNSVDTMRARDMPSLIPNNLDGTLMPCDPSPSC